MESELASTEELTEPGAKLLVADDSTNERSALAQYLRRMGYQVSEAGDGRAAIDHIQNHEIDALLLDLNMPVADGFDVLGYLQKHRRSLPVILLSGMPLDQIQQQIHGLPKAELPPLMLKPIDVDQLMEVLELQLHGDLSRSIADAEKQQQQQSN